MGARSRLTMTPAEAVAARIDQLERDVATLKARAAAGVLIGDWHARTEDDGATLVVENVRTSARTIITTA